MSAKVNRNIAIALAWTACVAAILPGESASAAPTDDLARWRKVRGLGPVIPVESLDRAAAVQARRIAALGRLDHSGLGDRVRSAGAGFDLTESLASGQSTFSESLAAWGASSSHAANLLDARAQRAGIGMARDASGRTYWVRLSRIGG